MQLGKNDGPVFLQQTLGAFQRLIDAGRIRYAAASNYSAARLRERNRPRRIFAQPNLRASCAAT